MRNIIVEDLHGTPVKDHKVELVERKGIGHPDTICDEIMNNVSVNLSKYYLEKFGAVMHHNTDKSLLVAGEANQKFGGGEILAPMLLVFGDRATYEVQGELIPVTEIAVKSAKEWLQKNLRFVDPEKNMIYQVELKKGSAALRDIFERKGDLLGANDTSAAVGYAPFTQTEQIVFDLERHLNSKDFKIKFPEAGEDVKIMGLRTKGDLTLTVAMPLVDKYVESEDDYFKKKTVLEEQMRNFVSGKVDLNTKIAFNTLDARGRGTGGLYLTVTGTCAEDADCGQVGRGNIVNGIIPLNRPISNEAAAGKNPVSHIGKIYNVMSHTLANKIYKEVPGIQEVYVWLLSQIGTPIDKPHVAAAQIIMESGSIDDVKVQVQEIIDKELENIGQFTLDLAHGKYPIC